MSAAVARMPQVGWGQRTAVGPGTGAVRPWRPGAAPEAAGLTATARGGAAPSREAMREAGHGQQGGVDPAQRKPMARAAAGVPEGSLQFYRRYTELLLRRYMQLSLRMGRVPSVLGSCMFRGRVSSREMRSFEDTVIFVYDVERCMKVLGPEDRELIARVALQEYTQAEAAELTGQSLRTVVRKYGEAIDTLTRLFLEKELLEVGPLFKGM